MLLNLLQFILGLTLLVSFLIVFHHCVNIIKVISRVKKEFGKVRFTFMSIGTALVIGGAAAIFFNFSAIGGDMLLVGVACKFAADRREALNIKKSKLVGQAGRGVKA